MCCCIIWRSTDGELQFCAVRSDIYQKRLNQKIFILAFRTQISEGRSEPISGLSACNDRNFCYRLNKSANVRREERPEFRGLPLLAGSNIPCKFCLS
jgi:hypothetical protein